MNSKELCDTDAWFGREDTPAPQSFVSNPAPELTVGVSIAYDGVSVTVRYRKGGMGWQRIEARKSNRSKDAQYYIVRFPRFSLNTRVEYEVLVKSSGLRSIPERRIGEACWFEVVSESSNLIDDQPKPEPRVPANSESVSTRAGAQAITATAGNKQPNRVVFGTITFRTPISTDIQVQAVDKDMRSEEALGSVSLQGPFSASAAYRIEYSAEQFSRAEKKSADLIVRAFAQDRKLSAESDIHFNAGESERIDLVLVAAPITETPRLSELERLQESIESIRQGIDYHLFTNEDLIFLTEETIRRGILGNLQRPTISQRLEFLRLAGQFEQKTKTLLAAFYGWFRLELPLELNTLLDVPLSRLRATLELAIERNIIPVVADQIPEIIELIRSQEHFVSRTFMGQLLDRESGDPLAGYKVEVSAVTAGGQTTRIGRRLSDGGGSFTIAYPVPATTDNAESITTLLLRVLDTTGTEVHQTRVAAPEEQTVAHQIQVPTIAPVDRSPKLDELRAFVNGGLPQETIDALDARGIRTLEDVRRTGGLTRLENLPTALNPESLRLLDAHARLGVVSEGATVNQQLIEQGFDHPLAIASLPLFEFVRTVGERIGDLPAAQLHAGAVAQRQYVDAVLTEYRINFANSGVGFPGQFGELAREIAGQDACQCEDCEAAVSPLAYLADLLNYATTNVKIELTPPPVATYGSINLPWLEEQLHQRFADLPATCEAVDLRVRQARICCEVLRHLLAPAGGGGGLVEGAFPTGPSTIEYRRTAYKRLLEEVGTSYAELRDTIESGTDEQRGKLAERLGIMPPHLETLFIAVDDGATPPNETWLELHFGLQSTTRDPLTDGPTPHLLTWRQERLEIVWREIDYPADEYTDGALPIIDPDVIGPDDFRFPSLTELAFGLWQDRRALVDARLTALAEVVQSQGVSAALVEVYGDPPPDLLVLSKELQQSSEDEQFQTTLASLGLTSESLTRLAEITAQLNAGKPLGEEDSVDVVDILVQKEKQDLFAAWIQEEEEAALRLDPRIFWDSLRAPAAGTWPPQPPEGRPLIDPQLIDVDELVESAAGSAAHDIWQARSQQLSEDFTAVQLERETNGFDSMLLLALGDPAPGDALPHDLDELSDALASSDEAIRTLAETSISQDLLLSVEDFQILTTIRSKSLDANPQNLPSAKEWEKSYTILTRANKVKRLYPHWINEEEGPELDRYWKILKAQLPKWRSNAQRRQAWQSALQMRSRDALIDPDRLNFLDFVDRSDESAAFSLYKERRTWIQDRRAALQALLDTAPDVLTGLDRMCRLDEMDAPSLGVGTAALESLGEAQQSGANIAPRLKQLNLSQPALDYLLRIIERIQAGAELDETEWQAAFSILIRVSKNRLTAAWRDGERQVAELHLGPIHFARSAGPNLRRWRTKPQQRSDWDDRLAARLTQAETAVVALQQSVSSVEESTLPLLRGALIAATDAQGSTSQAKAKWVTEQLLIDAEADGCQITTRISQAIETLQNLIWGIRTGQVREAHPDWVLPETTNFDEQWKWIGSYATWRAAMFVFLYPENIAIPSLRRWQTPAVKQLVEQTRNRRLSPEGACVAANDYADYFRDVNQLSLEASCYAWTQMRAGECGAATPEKRRLFYLFARAKTSRKVYWSRHDFRIHNGYAQSFWEEVPGLEGPTKLVGAVPYDDFIFLFAIVRPKSGAKTILFTRYDLLANRWDDAPQALELPGDLTGFRNVVVVQRNSSSLAPELLLQSGQRIYRRKVTLEDLGSSPNNDDEESEEESDPWDDLGKRFEESPVSSGATLHNGKIVGAVVHKKGYCIFATYSGFAYAHNMDFQLKHHVHPTFPEKTEKMTRQLGSPWRGCVPWDENNDATRIFAFTGSSVHALRLFRDEAWNGLANVGFLNIEQVVTPAFTDVSKVAVHCDDQPSASASVKPMAYQLGAKLRLPIVETVSTASGITTLTAAREFSLAPEVTTVLDVPDQLSKTDRALRRFQLFAIDFFHSKFRESIRAYLDEAYYFVPVHLALQLCRAGHYLEALDWFRTVYDYSAANNQRIVSPLLSNNAKESNNFNRLQNWLLDPLNPHAIAATRQRAYTRFTLLSIIRCLLEYADAEFTRDTAQSVPRARVLYTTAEELLGSSELKQKLNGCDKLIGELEIDVSPGVQPLLSVVLGQLSDFNSLRQVESVTPQIMAIARLAELDDEQKVLRIDALIRSQRAAPQTVDTIENRLARQTELRFAAHASLLADRRVSQSAMNIATQTKTALRDAATVSGNGQSDADFSWLRKPLELDHVVAGPPSIPVNGDLSAAFARTNITPIAAVADFVDQPYSSTPSFQFCIPPNPVLKSFLLRTESNLFKIRHCRNIAGLERELEPYAAPTDTTSGLPVIGEGGQLVLPGISTFRPTAYRSKALLERAKELAQMAAQLEAAMLSAIEKRDAQLYEVLRARQDLKLAGAGIQLQNIRVHEAKSGVALAELQKKRAEIQVDHYDELLKEPTSEKERQALEMMQTSMNLQLAASITNFALAAFQTGAAIAFYVKGNTEQGVSATAGSLSATSGGLSNLAGQFSTNASILSTEASYERREQEWEFLKTLATHDVQIGAQQITLANDQVDVVEQEREIAQLRAQHAGEVVDFLINKFTNVELYDWMSDVLEDVYGFFLHEATSMAKVAENQLAFERQQTPPAFIKSDYWEIPDAAGGFGFADDGSTDRRGLTGAERLQKDVYQLDQYAFETDRRKLQLSKTFSLARLAPIEFQIFRESGVITFSTLLESFDRDFPGHYLRLIKRVRTAIIALIPPIDGVHATLATTGTSRVVIGGDVFQTTVLHHDPNSIALTAPQQNSQLFELDTQSEMLLPFEGMGVDTTWELRMPKAVNAFDYRTLADALITIEYTALDSFDYRQQVLQEFEPARSADRQFSFRHELSDPWYDLHNPAQTATPMLVQFQTRREDFPPNLSELKVEHVVLYFAFANSNGEPVEVQTSLRFTEEGSPGTFGGSSQTIDGVSSTRRGNAASWLPMIGRKPIGVWELELPDTPEMRQRFANEEIDNILFVITYGGRTADWPS